mgnify:CR=1 FL=1
MIKKYLPKLIHEKVDVNIEYSHISLQEKFSEEHRKSIELAKEVVNELKKEGKKTTLCVWVDDYSYIGVRESCITLNWLFKELLKMGLPPHYMFFQSTLAIKAELLLEEIPTSLIKKVNKGRGRTNIYLKPPDGGSKVLLKKIIRSRLFSGTKLNCPLMTAAWLLARLYGTGIDILKPDFVNPSLQEPPPFKGEELITILPKNLKYVEEKATKVIESTPYGKFLKKNSLRILLVVGGYHKSKGIGKRICRKNGKRLDC